MKSSRDEPLIKPVHFEPPAEPRLSPKIEAGPENCTDSSTVSAGDERIPAVTTSESVADSTVPSCSPVPSSSRDETATEASSSSPPSLKPQPLTPDSLSETAEPCPVDARTGSESTEIHTEIEEICSEIGEEARNEEAPSEVEESRHETAEICSEIAETHLTIERIPPGVVEDHSEVAKETQSAAAEEHLGTAVDSRSEVRTADEEVGLAVVNEGTETLQEPVASGAFAAQTLVSDENDSVIPETNKTGTVEGDSVLPECSDEARSGEVPKSAESAEQIESETNRFVEELATTTEETASLVVSINIEKMICEEDSCWQNKENSEEAAIIAAAWKDVDSSREELLAEVNLPTSDFEENDSLNGDDDDYERTAVDQSTVEIMETGTENEEVTEEAANSEANLETTAANEAAEVESFVEDVQPVIESSAVCSEENVCDTMESSETAIEEGKIDNQEERSSNEENATLLEESISIEKIICEDDNWDKNKAEDLQAVILAAAWNAVDSSTEKLLNEVALERVS